MRRWLFALLLLSGGLPAVCVTAQESGHLQELSLEQLLQVKVTSATRIEELARTAPATIYVITADEIRRLGLRDLKDILALVPGVDTIDPHFFLLGGQRGFVGSFSQSLLLIDGREANNLIAGETFISNQFRSGNIKQVEIINGPGSAIYGANALGGVINIITKTQKDYAGFELNASYGSWSTGEANTIFGWSGPYLKIRGSISYFQTNGDDFSSFLSEPSLASPAADNNSYRHLPAQFGYENDSSASLWNLRGESGHFFGGLDYYKNIASRGTSGIQWDYTHGFDHRDLSLTFIGYQHEYWHGKGSWTSEYRYYWEQFWGNHTETEGPLMNPATGETITTGATLADVEAFRGFYSNKNGGGSDKHVVNLQSTLAPDKRHTLLAGVQYEKSNIVAASFSRTEGEHPPIGPDQTRPAYNNYKWSVYVEDQIKLLGDSLIATAGLRYDRHERYGGAASPRLGIVGTIGSNSTLKLLYGEGFREPNVFEIQNSNGGIRPTELRTIEAGWQQYINSKLSNDIVLFRNRARDWIVTDEIAIGGISNKGTLRSRGLEDVVNLKIGDNFRGFLNYTYTTADLGEPEKGLHDVDDIAPHKANLALMGDLGNYSVGVAVRLRSGVQTEYHGARYHVSSYGAVDVTVGSRRLGRFGDHAGFDLVIKNIFNHTYFQPEPRAPSVVEHPQDGRDISLRLTFRP